MRRQPALAVTLFQLVRARLVHFRNQAEVQGETAFPTATTVLAGNGRMFNRKSHVVRDEQIEVAIAIVVHETAPRSPAWLITQEPGCFCYIGECAVAIVTVKNILSKPGAKDIVKSVVVVVSNADSAGPSDRVQPCLFGYVRKCPVAIVLVQAISSAFGCALQART